MSDDLPNEHLELAISDLIVSARNDGAGADEEDSDSTTAAASRIYALYAAATRMSSPSHDRAMAEGGWQDIAEAKPWKLTGKPIVALYADGYYAMRWWHAPAGCVPHWANENRPAFGEDPIAFWPIPDLPTPTTKEETAP